MRRILKILVVFAMLISVELYATDDRMQQIELKLKTLTTDMPGLEETVEMSVSGVSIQEFMRGLADAHKLNISVDPSISQSIVNNFSNATVSDVLIYLCKEYKLSINFIGSIMSVVKYEEINQPVKDLYTIEYNKSTDELSLDLKNNKLDDVVKSITQKSNKNVIISSGVLFF